MAVGRVGRDVDDAADRVETDGEGDLVAETLAWVPEELRGQWRRQWVNAMEKGTRQMVPALVDVNNPGLTGPVQNQPDFQAGAVDHRTHFANAVPGLVRQAMAEYSELTGRTYAPVLTYDCEDADYVMIGLGSVTDDVVVTRNEDEHRWEARVGAELAGFAAYQLTDELVVFTHTVSPSLMSYTMPHSNTVSTAPFALVT